MSATQVFPVLSPDGHRGAQSPSSPKTNHHPYAIKTTSTGILTRSNSSGHNFHAHHYYFPTSPSPVSKHRPSKSDLTHKHSANPIAPPPRPLPVPPSPTSPDHQRRDPFGGYESADDVQSCRPRKLHSFSGEPVTPSIPQEDLPSNPRTWSTAQLASYLMTALRVRSGESLPLPLLVAKDITAFVKEAKLNGRSFLRLTEEELEDMGINNLWRVALLNASRNLKQNVLKGRIWGFGEDDAPAPGTGHSPFNNALYHSSESSLDLPGSIDSTPSKVRTRSGRVRGMIESLERSSSFSSHSGSGSEFEGCKPSFDEESALTSGSEGDDEGLGLRRRGRAKILQGSEIQHSPTSSDSDPLLEPMTPLESPNPSSTNVAVLTMTDEPSIQDLLANEPDNMNKSWGAMAWEEIDLRPAETVKRILESERDGSQTVTSSQGSGKSSKESRANVEDIFSRPLPTPPSQNPAPAPMSNAEEPKEMQRPVRPLPIPPIPDEVADAADITIVQDDPGDGKTVIDEDVSDERTDAAINELHMAQDLLEIFKTRLDELEKKLEELESKQSDNGARTSTNDTEDKMDEEGKSYDPAASTDDDDKVLQELLQGPPANSETALVRKEMVPGEGERSWDPLNGGSLSSYILMASLGVCVIVVQTMVRRWVAKKA